jgi:hypothetical protein
MMTRRVRRITHFSYLAADALLGFTPVVEESVRPERG